MTAIIGQCSRRTPAAIRNRALLYRSGLRITELLAAQHLRLRGQVTHTGSIRW